MCVEAWDMCELRCVHAWTQTATMEDMFPKRKFQSLSSLWAFPGRVGVWTAGPKGKHHIQVWQRTDLRSQDLGSFLGDAG